MIFADSRYATANIFKSYNDKLGASQVVVLREFPIDSSAFYYYMWQENDRIESVAANLLGDSNLWWRIMDFNPEIVNPFSIQIGTMLRIPYEQ